MDKSDTTPLLLDNRARQGICNGLWMGAVCWLVIAAVWCVL